MTDYLKELKELLDRFQPTEIEKEYPTVFDISGYPRYENVISNWYAFFLDTENPHGLKNLFYSSLQELLCLEGSGVSTCKVEREYHTKKGGRIDLLVYEGKENGVFVNPIIIENKIYAGLEDNDLEDYFKSVESTSNSKQGLILSLYGDEKNNAGIVNDNFEEETHKKYMEIVKKNMSNYIINANPKYINLLLDFIVNIEKMTRVISMDENSKFYFLNNKKIDGMLNIRSKAYETVINNTSRTIEDKKGWRWGRSYARDAYFYFSLGDTGASYYIMLDGLKFTVKLWMNKKLSDWMKSRDVVQKNRVMNGFFEKSSGHKEPLNENNLLAAITYTIKDSDLDKYHEQIIDKISAEWEPFLKEMQTINAQ